MKRIYFYALLLMVISSCESEPEVECFPVRVVTKQISGNSNISITADYKYEGDLIDRIIWSNSQTHYYTYNTGNLLEKVEQFDVKFLHKTEYRMQYDGVQLLRLDEYSSNLNYLTQLEVDTMQVGYRDYLYQGINVSQERVYTLNEGSRDFELSLTNEFEYDLSGNMVSMVSIDQLQGDTVARYTFAYDVQKNPYGSLNLYFSGESHVNNIINRVDELNAETSIFQISYTTTRYPEQIVVRENGYLNKIITYEYSCR